MLYIASYDWTLLLMEKGEGRQGRIQDFKLWGALKKIAPSGGRRENFGVFRVKNHDFTPKNLIFSNFSGGWCVPLDPPLRIYFCNTMYNVFWRLTYSFHPKYLCVIHHVHSAFCQCVLNHLIQNIFIIGRILAVRLNHLCVI